jgi:hypothetical protein
MKNLRKIDRIREKNDFSEKTESLARNQTQNMITNERPISIEINNNINVNFEHFFSDKNRINDISQISNCNDSIDNVIDKFLKVKKVKSDILKSKFLLYQNQNFLSNSN